MAPSKTLTTMEKVLKFVGDIAMLFKNGLEGITKLKEIFKSFAWTLPVIMKVFEFLKSRLSARFLPTPVVVKEVPRALAQYGEPTKAMIEEAIELKKLARSDLESALCEEYASDESECEIDAIIRMQIETEVIREVTDTKDLTSTVPIDAEDADVPDVLVADCLEYIEPVNRDEDPEFRARLKFVEGLRKGDDSDEKKEKASMEVQNPTLNPRQHCVMNASLTTGIVDGRTKKMRGCRQGMLPMLRKSLIGECKWKFTPTDNTNLDLQVAKRLVMSKIAEYRINPNLGSKLMKDLPQRIITPDQIELEAVREVTGGASALARGSFASHLIA